MLQQLYIENIAVIERSSLELTAGFNLLTGETGAGKSIVIDAINAVLGERTSRDLIRTGCSRAEVTAVFTLSPKLAGEIADLGYPAEDGSLILSRTLTTDGRNLCKVGGRPATLSILREIGSRLINIHGQHDSQALLNPETHYQHLDALAENDAIHARYLDALEAYKKIIRELRALQTDEDAQEKRADLLRYQIDELRAADLQQGETEALRSRRHALQNSAEILRALAGVSALLRGAEEQSGAADLLNAAAEEGERAAALLPELSALSERTADLAAEVEGLYADWQQVLESTDFSPEELTQVEERLNLLYDLSGKYGEDEAAMLDYLAKAEAELKAISSSAERIAALEAEQDSAGEVLIAAAAALTESRRKAGERFSAAVREELAFLNMPGVEFSVSIQPSSYNKTGADRVEFLISANAGEAPRPLAKVASGGELSRVMLAIKCVLAEKDAVPTLIFDEIDTGISGRAARAVGVKLKQVSRGRQVICITHLAQIAAMADNHMLIEKRVEGGRTFTAVERLSENDRVTEIARILSGGQLTESLEQTAREMIEYGKTV